MQIGVAMLNTRLSRPMWQLSQQEAIDLISGAMNMRKDYLPMRIANTPVPYGNDLK